MEQIAALTRVRACRKRPEAAAGTVHAPLGSLLLHLCFVTAVDTLSGT